MEWSELLIRLVLSFGALLVLTRIMGKKEISQMTLFNFISAMTIGTLGGALVIDPALSLQNGILALAGWSCFTVLMGVIDIKFKPFRHLIEGDPVIVIKHGKILENALRKTQLDIDALRTMLREKDIFSLQDVEYAIFEVDGKLSVMKKEANPFVNGKIPPVVRKAFNPVSAEIVSDGIINRENLAKLRLDEQWLCEQFQLSGIKKVSDVFYAEIQSDGSLYIDCRKDMLH
ncbi:DUF421 domain-containing protein [Mesobacillus foraminis]|uniref:DUF421 domain-containing protein n=1 Tax=Mesobacillus foraminis TaxID=279826 RepID=UPI001BE53E98|nr:DUF421 domain-containing protein [Mesobacillus foraminis]MBT2755322.1 DUF421 domain-containing protein [Mesobacillus foraminis]